MNDRFDTMFTSLGQVAIAFLGGLIGALMRREASTWQTAILGACGAGFVGFLVAKLCHASGLSDDWTFVMVGVSGWLGAERTISYLERLFAARLGIEQAAAAEPPPAAAGDKEKQS
ncbi:holin [Burkholderia phage BcepNY3]|uniref:Gp31 n=5 Tax=root TaxID=1 RepID=Q6UJ01_9CAUD|nr:holin [Burkholderia phage Bcep1]YP_001294866.1 holin [Burkholderia phage BcepNY3]AAQ73377.1 gp31 [Burkholderia phage Bcep1]ABR10563.1 holin [Burkholderia phage BcepNY3]